MIVDLVKRALPGYALRRLCRQVRMRNVLEKKTHGRAGVSKVPPQELSQAQTIGAQWNSQHKTWVAPAGDRHALASPLDDDTGSQR